VEGKGSGDESVDAEEWFEVETPANINAEGSTAAQPIMVKSRKNKLKRRGSPTV
jgi:hypothetical protein